MLDENTLEKFLQVDASVDNIASTEKHPFTETEIVDLITQLDDSTPDQLIPHRVTTHNQPGQKTLTEAYYWSIAHGQDPERIGYQFVLQGEHDSSFFDQTTLFRFIHTPLNQAEVEFYYDFLKGKSESYPGQSGVIAGLTTDNSPSRIKPLGDDEIIDPETQSRVKVEVVARYRDGKWQLSEEEVKQQEIQSIRKQASHLIAATKRQTPSPN